MRSLASVLKAERVLEMELSEIVIARRQVFFFRRPRKRIKDLLPFLA